MEIEPRLVKAAGMMLGDNSRLTLLGCDVLESKHVINPEVVSAIRKRWDSGKFARFKLIANLPYAISSSLLAELLEFEPLVERMCFTVQREVAERLSAKPGSGDYGWLSVLVQSLANVEVMSDIPASCFWPRPKVTSSIVRLMTKSERPEPVKLETLRSLGLHMFQHRRKMMLGNLKRYQALCSGTWTAEEVLTQANVLGTVRPENVTVQQWWALVDAIRQHESHGEESM